ncbi:MAG: lytic transglycosylase domain-containing protein [Chromatiales bacterium]|nr:lytic transglycosylase domain-containing protein [Chromatiales bacterium]
MKIVLLAVLLGGQSAYAAIYKYEDRQGNLYFTDRPMKGKGYRLLWRSGPDRKSTGRSRVNTAAFEKNRKKYTPLIEQIARESHLHPALLHAVVRAESSYDPNALSKKGAMGLMQLMPATAKRFGVSDTWNPKQNLSGGARYLKVLLELFDNDLELAVAAYNAGENAVIKYGYKIPPYPETQQYVVKVLGWYEEYTSNS